ncbi:coiled-coil domain-containing protein 73 isoform X2 [Narcine bancroftii]|uniref:coiled-coil domain-containing protein 73 isoform X2 n=1 Tax=Narcine bancroftii TaxID=1343680 RepID=UPI00383214CB
MRGKAARTRKGIRRFGKLIFLNSQMDNKMTGNLESSNDGLHITYNLQSSAPAVLCSVHQLEFKTSLLEMVEELRICRAAESRYEEQISKLVVEKQELEWQKESLQNQNNALSSQHEEAIIALKKQFQIQVNAVEEEKGKFQLSSESKEREINGLKEELKILQVSKYNLEKKQSELEQKVNLQNIAKDNQLSQLSKVEKRFAAISHQYGLVIQAHGKLEQNVEEATRLNKKLMTMNENHESTIRELKQELEKVTADLIRSKVTSQYNLGEDNIHLTTQQQQLQELKQKLQMEIELNKKLSKEKSAVQEEKQEILKLFQQTQQLLQRQELALGRAETELKYFEEKHQGLERDNELLREKAKENEDKCQILERENEKSTGQWKKEETQLNKENQQIKSELESFKKAHASCQEIYSKLPAQTVHEQQMQAEQNILQHSEQATVQETAEEQTYASEALMDTDSKVKHLATHSHILEEVYEESNELGFKRQGNGNQNRMVNTVNNSNKFSPDITKPGTEMAGEETDNGTIFVNEKECISVLTVEGNIEVSKDFQQGKTGNLFHKAESASAKLEAQYNSVCLADVPVEGRKMLSDSTDALGACSADVDQQMNSIAHKFSDTTDKTETTQCDKGVFINEPPRIKARATLGSDEILTKEVSANEVQCDTNQALLHAVPDLDSPSVNEIKNEQDFILQQQQGCHSRREENCVNSGKIGPYPLLNPCCKSDVSSTKLFTDQSNHSIHNTCVDPDEIDISVEIPLGPSNHGKDITEEDGNNSESKFVSTDDLQKDTNDPVALIPDSGTVKSHLLLNFTSNVEHSLVITPNSQEIKEVHNDFAATVDRGQAEISQIGLCTEIQVGISSKITENESKPIFIKTALNPVATISVDCRDEMSTSETEASSGKATANQCCWKFPSLPSLTSSKGKNMPSKSTASLPFSMPRDKLEAPATSRKVPLTFTFPTSISETSLTRSIVADSPSTKRVNDTFNTSSVPLYPKRNSKEDWNAIPQTFCDFSRPPEQEKLCSPISESFKILNQPSFTGHKQFTESSSTCFQVPEVATSTTKNLLFEEESDTAYSMVKGQIDKIERFLCVERLKHTRKRKAADNTDKHVSKVTPT